MSRKSDSVQCGYGSSLDSNGFLARRKRKPLEVVPEQWGRSACSTLQVVLEAARSSGLDQHQVSEDTTTVWLCLHVKSNPASG